MSIYNYFTHASNDMLTYQLMNMKTHGLSYSIIDVTIFFISNERGQASRGIIDIPTRLAPRETSILCRQNRKKLLKKGEKEKETEETTKTSQKTDYGNL
jgi:hypothetical protein